MAKSIPYEVPRKETGETAQDELARLMENLHRQGILRLLNDVVTAYPQVAEIFLRGMNQEQSRNLVQNLCLLASALGQVPPERLDRVVQAVSAGMERSEAELAEGGGQSPGFWGALRLLQDNELWAGLAPMSAGVKAFAAAMRTPTGKPVERRYSRAAGGSSG